MDMDEMQKALENDAAVAPARRQANTGDVVTTRSLLKMQPLPPPSPEAAAIVEEAKRAEPVAPSSVTNPGIIPESLRVPDADVALPTTELAGEEIPSNPRAADLYRWIRHGDLKHRQWLGRMLQHYFEDIPSLEELDGELASVSKALAINLICQASRVAEGLPTGESMSAIGGMHILERVKDLITASEAVDRIGDKALLRSTKS